MMPSRVTLPICLTLLSLLADQIGLGFQLLRTFQLNQRLAGRLATVACLRTLRKQPYRVLARHNPSLSPPECVRSSRCAIGNSVSFSLLSEACSLELGVQSVSIDCTRHAFPYLCIHVPIRLRVQ